MERRTLLLFSVTALAMLGVGKYSYDRSYAATSVSAREAGPTRSPERAALPEIPQGPKDYAGKQERLRALRAAPVEGQAWEIIRTLSSAEIKKALADLIAGEVLPGMGEQLRALYYAWGQIDPRGAMEAAMTNEGGTYAVELVFDSWMKVDADAAYRWAQANDEAGLCSRNQKMAGLLSALPLREALAEAAKYDPEMRGDVWLYSANRAYGSAEDREAYLKEMEGAEIDPDKKGKALGNLFMGWGMAEPAEALDAMRTVFPDSPEKELSRRAIMQTWRERDPEKFLAWMAGEGNASVGEQAKAFQQWSQASPEDAGAHLTELSAKTPGLREEVMKSHLVSLYMEGWGPTGRTDPAAEAYMAPLRAQYLRWQKDAPAEADAWLEKIEPALRVKLQSAK